MKTKRNNVPAIGCLFLVLLAALLACGSTDSGSTDSIEGQGPARLLGANGSAGSPGGAYATAAPAAYKVEVVTEVEVTRVVERSVPAAAPTAVPRPSSQQAPAARAAPAAPTPAAAAPVKIQASLAAQNRIIVHTGDMLLVVDDVAGSVDRVISLARESGGWVVSSDRSSRHSGFVAVRVPAGSLTGVMERLENMAIDVKSRSLSSQDVTDEYVDSQSRLTSLRETEAALLGLLARAGDVEDALEVQREITQLQVQIEELQGRINFLQETAAYSLLNVRLELSTVSMPVDVGSDGAFRVGQSIRFRATFQPPEGIEEFSFVWDFGDGSREGGGGSAPKADDPGSRVTSSVGHVYAEEGDYIARITLNGAGEAGLAEGSDALIASVTRVPVIEAFAGDDRVVDEGDEVDYRASFTRPEGLWDFQFRWDFGDGTPTVTGNPDEGATRAGVVHAYADHRPQPYTPTFTVSAMSDAGRVSASSSFGVRVNESVGLVVGGWDFGGTGKAALRALSAVGRALVTALIWVGIFSPVWLIVGGFLVYGARRRRAREDARQPVPGAPEGIPPVDPTIRE